jgi:hypothetical protein
MILRHHNYSLDGSDLPLFVGDRFFGQDILRDFFSNREYSGMIQEDLLGLQESYTGNIVINGLTVTQGALHTLSWTKGRVKVTHTLKTPTDWTALPPAMTSRTIPINIDIPAVTNQALSGTTNDSATPNYAKFSYNEVGASTRTRAKKAGTYSSEITESYTFSCNATPPTASEVAFATFTTDGTTITFTNDEPRWNKVKSVTATYTAKIYDRYISGSGTFTINLPTVATAKGQSLCIDNIGVGTLTADGNAGETIEGYTTVAIYPQKKLVLYCNGTLWQIINDFEITHSSTADYVITDSDLYKKFIIPHSATTGLIQRTLPTLADNIGKRFPFQNVGDGLSYINSEEGGNILFKEYSLDKLILVKKNDKATLLATSSGWLVEEYHMCIESGWYNRADWTGVKIGFANFDYDTKSGGTGDMTGQKYVLASGVTGLILNDSQPAAAAGIATVCFVTGTGLAVNDEVGTCGSGQTFAVNEGGGNNKNQDNNVTHNMAISLRELIKISLYLSEDKTEAKTYEIVLFSQTYSANGFGAMVKGVDTNNIKTQTAVGGLVITDDSGTPVNVMTQDWYGEVKVEMKS